MTGTDISADPVSPLAYLSILPFPAWSIAERVYDFAQAQLPAMSSVMGRLQMRLTGRRLFEYHSIDREYSRNLVDMLARLTKNNIPDG